MGLWCRCAWVWCCLLSLAVLTWSLELQDLFEFGEEAGDQKLRPGPDSTVELLLNGSVWFFGQSLDKVYVCTNGLVAGAQPPAEERYLGRTPAAFPAMAVLLGDLDTGDAGAVFFREDAAPRVLRQAAEHIGRAFPSVTAVDPSSALIVTWQNMAAHGTLGRGDGLDTKRNTFQLVVASTASASFAILLYPRGTLQFVSTAVGGASRLLEAGFNQGLVQHWLWGSTQGKHFPTTTEEEASVRELTEKTNSGRRGVWVYDISGTHIAAGLVPSDLSSAEPTTDPTSTIQPALMIQEVPEENEDFSTETPLEFQPRFPEAEVITPEYSESGPEDPDHIEPDLFEAGKPETEAVTAANTHPTQPELRHRGQPKTTNPTHAAPETTEPLYSTVGSMHPEQAESTEPTEPLPPAHIPESGVPTFPAVHPMPDPDLVQSRYIHPDSAQPQMVTVDEDEDLDIDVFSYSLETCAHNRHRCSAFADCRDHSGGYCCHCRPGYYGNGKDCVAEGKPQRMNGKVSGRVFVGDMLIELQNKDLHSYVVANDGRAYVAVSSIPPSLGPSLLPLSPLGGVIGWAFALEQPGFRNGFSLVGGVFARQAEVTFQPGNERLSIKQQFTGIDEHDHLVVSTEMEGHVPVVPLGSTVQIDPYKEIYQYDRNLVTSSSNRNYTVTSPHGLVQGRSYQWRQTITFQSCPHDDTSRTAAPTQQLSVDQIFVMFDPDNLLIRYAMSNRIGPIHSSLPEQNPCFTGRHGCDINAVCRPADGLHFSCQCAAGFTGDGRYCHDADECQQIPPVCGTNAICSNQPGTFRCECTAGFVFASDGRTCSEERRPVNHCQTGSHDCDAADRAVCSYRGGSAYACSCLPGFVGDGRMCQDSDECQQDPCHRDALCSNAHGSYTCQCRPGFHGDGFQCSPTSTEREKSPCERHRDQASSSTGLLSFFRPRPPVGLYVPQCDQHGAYESTQCHSSLGQCWCVDASGQELPNTRTGPGSTPLCINQAVSPPPVGPTPRPDVRPVAPGTHLLFAQSGKIEHVPLDGYRIKKQEAKPLLHVPDRVLIAVTYDCVEKTVYWTDITGPSISRARLSGGDISPVITKELQSPEGVAVDHVARLLFWTDSMRDTVEVSKLDGSQRRVLFDTELVSPRPIVTNPAYGRIYWADWNRDGPKIEMSNMDGTERTILVKDDLGLPNGLTFDPDNQLLCWADAGTRKLECMDPHRRIRRQVADGIQYPFALVSYGKNLYYTDWRREAVVAVDRRSEKETQEFLPQRRSRVYGITTTTTQCPQVYNYCSNNGGCSHLCLPRLGGFTCRCPDASDAQCAEMNP
ncbi:nidogen-1-like [Betta splendens]|uniref:Nidogen-1-like n=1 Tax=Betta splendens TaxID=158456 RepID=A0A6P7MSU4_BETSP|nr:nidogen-1-like [Betta splendens]XP_055365864.1 nidogen-1-like [Betta splendens]XP_055365866.1 nidogen-1-like [Betta splendens]